MLAADTMLMPMEEAGFPVEPMTPTATPTATPTSEAMAVDAPVESVPLTDPLVMSWSLGALDSPEQVLFTTRNFEAKSVPHANCWT